MARFGVLTGGGDCPGLNAVIRAIVRRGNQLGHEFFGYRYGWAGVLAGDGAELTADVTRGILHRGGTILGTSRTNPYKEENGLERVKASLAQHNLDGLIPIGGEDTLGVARPAVRGRHRRRRRAEDDRQRPRRHRLHVRLPDRGADRHRRDRPPAHHGRVAQPRDRRRGHGAHRGLDRLLLRDGRRRRRDPRARAAVRHRGGLRAGPPPPRERPFVLDRRGRRGGDAEGRRGQVRVRGRDGRLRPRAARRHRRAPRARDRGAHRLRVAHDDPRPRPARRHAAGLRPRARDALRRGGDRRRGPGQLRQDGRAARAPRSSSCRSTRRWPSRSCSTRGCTRRPRCSSGSSVRAVFKQGPVPAFVHGIVEYLAAILFIAAPFIFDFDEDAAVGPVADRRRADPDHRRVDALADRADPVDPRAGARDARLRAGDLPDRLAVHPRLLRRRDGRGVLHRDRRRAPAAHDRHAVRARRAAAARSRAPPKKPA